MQRVSSAKSPPPAEAYHRSFSSSSVIASAPSPVLRRSRARLSRAVAARRPSPLAAASPIAWSIGRRGARIAHPLLHAGERGPVQRGLAEEAHGGGLLGGVLEGGGGVVEAMLGLRDGAEHGLPVHQAPRVADRARMLDRLRRIARALRRCRPA